MLREIYHLADLLSVDRRVLSNAAMKHGAGVYYYYFWDGHMWFVAGEHDTDSISRQHIPRTDLLFPFVYLSAIMPLRWPPNAL